MSAAREKPVGGFAARPRESGKRQGLDAAGIEARIEFTAPLFRASLQRNAERIAGEGAEA